MLMDKHEEFRKLMEVMRYSVFLIPHPSGRCCSPNPNSTVALGVFLSVFIAFRSSLKILCSLFAYPSVFSTIHTVANLLWARSLFADPCCKKTACPVSPLFFCNFFYSKSSVIHVFAAYDASSPCRGELWFVRKHILRFHRLLTVLRPAHLTGGSACWAVLVGF